MRAALQQFDRVVFVSQFLRDEFIERFAMDQFDHPSRVSVIPNALRTDAVFPAVAPLYDVVYVGRLVPEKGVDQLLLAASRDGNQWKIAVVGGKYFNVQPALDPYEERLREIVRSRALDVEFTGPVEPSRVLEFFSKARVAVIPSVWPEPAGLALLEAMASPAAAVATRVGGMPELAPLGSVTWVPPSAPGAIREAVDGLLGDERRRVAQVQRANAAAAGWTWEMAYRLLIE
jgi:glycosyltransferase involved in cell wall biosynthesis